MVRGAAAAASSNAKPRGRQAIREAALETDQESEKAKGKDKVSAKAPERQR